MLEALPDGTSFITIPNIALPPGWNKPMTSISFIAPVGYPNAKPDCFYADSDLRLAGQAMPQGTQLNSIPGRSQAYLWFSWHLASWSPVSDSLLTYVRVIEQRLSQAR